MSTAAAVIADLTARGVTLRVVAGQLEVRPASALTDRDRTAIRACLPELVSELTVCASSFEYVLAWELDEAIRRMHDADTLVERLGVDGRQPAIQDAAGRVVEAFAASDPKAFQTALNAFVTAVRDVAGADSPRSDVA